jgi:hypothetical protein
MPAVANLKDLRETHRNDSMLKCLKMVFANKPIAMTSGKSPIAWKEQVPALVGESQSMFTCTKYNKIYWSQNKGGYPQGIQMQFVPVAPSMKMSENRKNVVQTKGLPCIPGYHLHHHHCRSASLYSQAWEKLVPDPHGHEILQDS